jgi:SAM-dependent methyltransferase
MRTSSSNPAIEREFRDFLHGREPRAAHARRTAAANAAFFLPYLKPGMRLLDIGCGPGSITLGLAEAVAPGEAVGVDANPRSIEFACANTTAPNLRFELADLYRLPFEPESFDAVFMHAVLQHVPDPERAVRMASGLLRPGGVIGLADADWGGSIIAPETRPLRRAFRLMEAIRRYSGGDIYVGRKLGTLLAKAGLESVTCTVGAGCDGTPAATRMVGGFNAAYYGSPEMRRYLPALGLASEAEIEEAAAAWQTWAETPGAMWARYRCQATATKP